MKKLLRTYKKYFVLSAIIFFILSSFFIILSQIDQTYVYYDDAINELKDDSLVPKSVMVHRASHNDTQVFIEFSDRDLEGIESGRILAIYTYNSEEANKLRYYFKGEVNYAVAYYGLVYNQEFPAYVLGHQLHPFLTVGIISFVFGLLIIVILKVNWLYKDPDKQDEVIELSLENSDENSDTETIINNL